MRESAAVDFLVVAATSSEVDWIRRELHGLCLVCRHPWRLEIGPIGNAELGLLECGVGEVNAGAGLAWTLSRIQPRLVVLIGAGGAYRNSGLNVGDFALATEEHYGELGVRTRRGWRDWNAVGLPLLQGSSDSKPGCFVVERRLVAKFRNLAHESGLEGATLKVGPFVTVSQVSGDDWAADLMSRRFDGLVENMEGAGVAHVAQRFGIPFVEYRVVSNYCGDRDKRNWDLRNSLVGNQRTVLQVLAAWEVKADGI